MVHFWVAIGWRWFVRFFVVLILVPCFLVEAFFGVPTWSYLWNHYIWEPYIPFIVGFIILFIVTLLPFGKKQPLGGENPNA